MHLLFLLLVSLSSTPFILKYPSNYQQYCDYCYEKLKENYDNYLKRCNTSKKKTKANNSAKSGRPLLKCPAHPSCQGEDIKEPVNNPGRVSDREQRWDTHRRRVALKRELLGPYFESQMSFKGRLPPRPWLSRGPKRQGEEVC